MFAQQPKVDLTSCDLEPIHVPGRIQSHGVLFVLAEPSLTIEQLSSNTEPILGHSPLESLQKPIDQLLGNRTLLETQIRHLNDRPVQSFKLSHADQLFQAVIHRNPQGRLILELELESTPLLEHRQDYTNLFDLMTDSISKLENASSLDALYNQTVKEIRHIIGYDRVKLYRFDLDWHGHVVAESKAEHMPSYLGLHFPASDIPKQARSLYVRNRARIIVDVDSDPVGIYRLEQDTEPLDMSDSILRAVSPIHIEYLQNMAVGASMSISILKDGQLWGLIACHHQHAKLVPYQIRMMCKLLSLTFSTQLVAKEQEVETDADKQTHKLQADLFEFMLNAEDPMISLVTRIDDLLDLVKAEGVAIWLNGALKLAGNTPKINEVEMLVEWLIHEQLHPIYQTDHLSKAFPIAIQFSAQASGVLSLKISKAYEQFIIWFRPEQTHTVTWAGAPSKAVIAQNDGVRLSPRKSFEKWSEEIGHKSVAWRQSDLETAQKLHSNLVDVVLRRITDLETLNLRLEKSNIELDAFAYIASHDLKEPLRGIHNYASIVMRRYADALGEDGSNKLATMVRLTQRLDTLLDSLLHFSRVGRLELFVEDVDLNEVVSEVIESLHGRIDPHRTEISLPRQLPTVRGDRTQLMEVFSNLISNGIKYNEQPTQQIEIGYVDDQEQPLTTFYIKDNGIGIPENHHETVFQIFKRLHQRQAYGGGSGAGLTIVKKIVERHNGAIWIESKLEKGTTFYFTLDAESNT